MTEQTALEATGTSTLDRTCRYLRPVARLELPDQPNEVHLAIISWNTILEDWVHGLALCGYSTTQGALPEGTAVTCKGCLGYRDWYERTLAPGNQPAADDPEALRARAATAEKLLRAVVELNAITHKYAIQGGHDCLGENLTCAGCALDNKIRTHLEAR